MPPKKSHQKIFWPSHEKVAKKPWYLRIFGGAPVSELCQVSYPSQFGVFLTHCQFSSVSVKITDIAKFWQRQVASVSAKITDIAQYWQRQVTSVSAKITQNIRFWPNFGNIFSKMTPRQPIFCWKYSQLGQIVPKTGLNPPGPARDGPHVALIFFFFLAHPLKKKYPSLDSPWHPWPAHVHGFCISHTLIYMRIHRPHIPKRHICTRTHIPHTIRAYHAVTYRTDRRVRHETLLVIVLSRVFIACAMID